MVRRTVPVFLFVGLVVLAAACSSDDEPSADSTSTTRAPSTTVSTIVPDDAEAAVRAAFDAANRAFIEAAAIPDPDFPALIATHVGPMLKQRQDVLRALKSDGRQIRYPPSSRFHVDVTEVVADGDVARIRFCGVDDGERVDAATGDVISSGIVTTRGRAALRLIEGEWKLAEQRFDSQEDGETGCD